MQLYYRYRKDNTNGYGNKWRIAIITRPRNSCLRIFGPIDQNQTPTTPARISQNPIAFFLIFSCWIGVVWKVLALQPILFSRCHHRGCFSLSLACFQLSLLSLFLLEIVVGSFQPRVCALRERSGHLVHFPRPCSLLSWVFLLCLSLPSLSLSIRLLLFSLVFHLRTHHQCPSLWLSFHLLSSPSLWAWPYISFWPWCLCFLWFFLRPFCVILPLQVPLYRAH